MSRWQFRRSKSFLGGLVRLTVSRTGASVSAGVPGIRFSLGRRGLRRTVSIPGTGAYRTDTLSRPDTSTPERVQIVPTEGEEKG